MNGRIGVSVIIPTTLVATRAHSLQRALNSVFNQEGVHAEIIIVANGPNCDKALFSELQTDPRLRVVYLSEGSLPAALRHGRSLVTQNYFSFLDDDDEYLAGALAMRVEPMLRDPKIDLVVTNGHTRYYEDEIRVENPEAVNRDSLTALFTQNWLASCGGLFRASAIDMNYFDGQTRYFEWTLLAYRLGLDRRKMLFLDIPSYRVYNTPGSLSKSEEYEIALANFLIMLLAFKPPPKVCMLIRRKLADAMHGLSDYNRVAGKGVRAWEYHFKSLCLPGGWRYWLYTLRLPPFGWLYQRIRSG